jgi:hypothetical protein
MQYFKATSPICSPFKNILKITTLVPAFKTDMMATVPRRR